MHPNLKDIPDRILSLAVAALAQANMHSAFMDSGREYWPNISVLNSAHAGELFIKAIIAKEHPLFVFKDIFNLDDKSGVYPNISDLIKKGRTHDFDKLPQILWMTTGLKIPDLESFNKLRMIRNAIQHFCVPEEEDIGGVALEFIYLNIDPLIKREFGLCAIEYHEDEFCDYLVATILRRGLKFSIPTDFNLTEISLKDESVNAKPAYKKWLRSELSRIGKLNLLD